MFKAMQAYREGERTFCNAVNSKLYKSMEAAIMTAKKKAKGLPYVTEGVSIVWTPFHGLQDKKSISDFVAQP